VVVAELDVEGVAVFETEADTPLIVHRDRELPFAVARERMQAIAGRYLEVLDASGRVHLLHLAPGALGDVRRNATCLAGQIELLRLPVSERLDHDR